MVLKMSTQWKIVIGGPQLTKRRWKSGHTYECKRDAIKRIERIMNSKDSEVSVVYLIKVEDGNVQRLEARFGEKTAIHAYEHRFTRIKKRTAK